MISTPVISNIDGIGTKVYYNDLSNWHQVSLTHRGYIMPLFTGITKPAKHSAMDNWLGDDETVSTVSQYLLTH